ncbi:MAG: hypothetical protein IJP68_02635, partial [Selenomonadaceae bacterium]|nr:hypothetical protein [Selenomonadaceae bacterium]
MTNDVCSLAYQETAVNEIIFLERNAVLHINATEKKLHTDFTDYKEYSIPLDSAKGIETLDCWVELWGKVLRGVAQHTELIAADLSGGFDTRVSFLILMNSGLDLNKLRIHSFKSDQFIFPEDYAIDSQIADHYGFKLNKPLSKQSFLNYSLSDAWNCDLYHQQTIRNLPTLSPPQKGVEKLYYIKGLSGETIRGYSHGLPKKFIENQTGVSKLHPHTLSSEIANSIEKIIESGFHAVRDKYKIADGDSPYIPQLLYQEVRARTHYGKESLGHYLKNKITLSPALDPGVRTLKLNTKECPDPKLLMALLFTRYAPDLLKFPFEG